MQVEHKTEKGTVLFVRVPGGAYNLSNNMQPNQLDYYTDTPFNGSKLTFSECIILPKVDWRLIGLTSEVKEDQAMNMLDYQSDNDEHQTPIFRCYVHGKYHLEPMESFKSLMQHLEVYEVNPIKKPNDDAQDGKYLRRLGEWQKAESRTGKWVVLFKEN